MSTIESGQHIPEQFVYTPAEKFTEEEGFLAHEIAKRRKRKVEDIVGIQRQPNLRGNLTEFIFDHS